VQFFSLTNKHGLRMKVSSYGAIISELWLPDRRGELADVVLGYESVEQYRAATPFFGAIVGRVANRIKDAAFELEGKRYQLSANNGPHTLHGGLNGWDKVVWQAELRDAERGPELHLSYLSPAGEEGFPANVKASVVYALTHDNELVVEMRAVTDAPTLVNMAHHSYWNLSGHGSGSIEDHELMLHADHYTPSAPVPGADPVPDGTIAAVAGTAFDFTSAKRIGKDLRTVGGDPAGFDDNWIVRGEAGRLRPVARLRDPKSGRVLSLEADQPGVQFYTGKFLDGSHRGKGAVYGRYAGLCLETQKYPNAINVPAWQDQVILRPGQTYAHQMVHRFSVE
jgi:aldose 1-epimerase